MPTAERKNKSLAILFLNPGLWILHAYIHILIQWGKEIHTCHYYSYDSAVYFNSWNPLFQLYFYSSQCVRFYRSALFLQLVSTDLYTQSFLLSMLPVCFQGLHLPWGNQFLIYSEIIILLWSIALCAYILFDYFYCFSPVFNHSLHSNQILYFLLLSLLLIILMFDYKITWLIAVCFPLYSLGNFHLFLKISNMYLILVLIFFLSLCYSTY